MILRSLQRLFDRIAPPRGPGSFRIHGVPGRPAAEPWWPKDDNDPDEIERAAAHPHWNDRPDERAALLEAAAKLRARS